MQHRINLPFLLQLLDGKTLEQVFTAGEIGIKRTREQRFAETTRTREKHIFARMRYLIYVLRLVYI